MKVKDQINGKIEKEESNLECSISEACKDILYGNSLKNKILHFYINNWELDKKNLSSKQKNIFPGRPENLKFSEQKIKFPKDQEFSQASARAKAIHFFANHELLAIEVMAKMILELPHNESFLPLKKEIWQTLQDEQRHLVLYQTRLQDLGFEIGDFPVNDYFWKIFTGIETFEGYFGLMSLTFESANLDFSAFYANLFSLHGDFSSAEVMKTIFKDEIHHVKLGYKYFDQHEKQKNTWSAYVESLPWPITPARSKGIRYQEQHRKLAGFSSEFINQLTHYNDSFTITERKR